MSSSRGINGMDAQRTKRHLVAIVMVALLLRAVVIAGFGTARGPSRDDTLVYYSSSKQLASSAEAWTLPGSQFGYRAPLYFVYLAGVFRLSAGAGYRTAQIATMACGVLACALLCLIRAGDMATSRAATGAAWMRVLLPVFVLTDTFVMSEPLFAVLLLLSVFVVVRCPSPPNWRHASVLGILVGLCMLTRESATGYPLVFGGALGFLGGNLRQRSGAMAVFLAALTMTLLPWMARNQVTYGKPLPLSYTMGPGLHIGNNPHATGVYQALRDAPPPGVAEATPEASGWHARQAVDYIKAQPARFLRNGINKVARFFYPTFSRDYLRNIYHEAPARLILVVSLFMGASSAVVVLCGLLGFALAGRDRLWWVTFCLIGYHVAVTFMAFASPRYRNPLDNLFVLYAAAFVLDLQAARRSTTGVRGFARGRIAIVAAVLLFVFGCWAVGATMHLSLPDGT